MERDQSVIHMFEISLRYVLFRQNMQMSQDLSVHTKTIAIFDMAGSWSSDVIF